MAPRFLINPNLTPALAAWLASAHGYDAVHVNDVALRGESDSRVLAFAILERRVVMTSNAGDFRKLMRAVDGHPGLAVLLDAVGRALPIELGVLLANAVEGLGAADGRLLQVDAAGRVRDYPLPRG